MNKIHKKSIDELLWEAHAYEGTPIGALVIAIAHIVDELHQKEVRLSDEQKIEIDRIRKQLESIDKRTKEYAGKMSAIDTSGLILPISASEPLLRGSYGFPDHLQDFINTLKDAKTLIEQTQLFLSILVKTDPLITLLQGSFTEKRENYQRETRSMQERIGTLHKSISVLGELIESYIWKVSKFWEHHILWKQRRNKWLLDFDNPETRSVFSRFHDSSNEKQPEFEPKDIFQKNPYLHTLIKSVIESIPNDIDKGDFSKLLHDLPILARGYYTRSRRWRVFMNDEKVLIESLFTVLGDLHTPYRDLQEYTSGKYRELETQEDVLDIRRLWIDLKVNKTTLDSPYAPTKKKDFLELLEKFTLWLIDDEWWTLFNLEPKDKELNPDEDDVLRKLQFQMYKNVVKIFEYILSQDVCEEDSILAELKTISVLKKKYLERLYQLKNPWVAKRKKENTTNLLQQQKKSYHYSITVDGHGEVSWLKEEKLQKPAKTVWSTIDQVKTRIRALCEADEKYGNILNLFPWMQNSTAGNLLVLWPYGTGKTALIRELGYDGSIVTIQVQASDFLSMWYGVTEKWPRNVFKLAEQKAEQTGMHVFVLIDEFDQMMNMSQSSNGNEAKSIQKDWQMLLDGLTSHPKVHLIWLSNEPTSIPMAIVRRVEVFITPELTSEERIELIRSRFTEFWVDDSLTQMYEKFIKLCNINKEELQGYREEFDNYVNWLQKDIQQTIRLPLQYPRKFIEYVLWKKIEVSHNDVILFAEIMLATPKILASICERTFLVMLERIRTEKWEKYVQGLNKKLWRIVDPKKRKKAIESANMQITLADFTKASHDIFEDPSIPSQIQANMKFYQDVKMIGRTDY
jgi:SpoVK/Ycf46/Vps4 family AAA+-type ATPase